MADWTPVYNPAALIYPAFFIKAHKHLFDSGIAALVHGESFSFPIGRSTQPVKLIYYPAAVFLFPLPCILEELLSAHFLLIEALVFEHVCNLDLGRYRRMIRARLPKCAVALHPLKSYKDVLYRIVERMAHVKLSSYVWRWHYYRKRLFLRICLRMKIALIKPLFI